VTVLVNKEPEQLISGMLLNWLPPSEQNIKRCWRVNHFPYYPLLSLWALKTTRSKHFELSRFILRFNKLRPEDANESVSSVFGVWI
jgi:hypothetical protein